jgi:hypothetical protein
VVRAVAINHRGALLVEPERADKASLVGGATALVDVPGLSPTTDRCETRLVETEDLVEPLFVRRTIAAQVVRAC